MGVELLLGLLGGLALFLYGMQMMSNNLEAAAGNKMKQILEKLTTNRFMGILVGAGITALIQSSSATTVMTVGFVNSGLMSLNRYHHYRTADRIRRRRFSTADRIYRCCTGGFCKE